MYNMNKSNYKIDISRGETAVFNTDYVFLDGSPYRLADVTDDYKLQFVVSVSTFDGKRAILTIYMSYTGYTFTDLETEEVPEGTFLIPPTTEVEGKLYYEVVGDVKDYRVVDSGAWVEYSFNVTFPILNEYTSEVDEGIYYWELTALAGVFDIESDSFDTISEKKVLTAPTTFTVLGSLTGK